MIALDHIVIAAKDPVQAAHDFWGKHEVTTVEGGRHTKWGTYNHLAYFSNDCYIEWLGIFDKSLAAKSENPLVQQLVAALEDNIEGPIQFALRTKRMDDYVGHFRASGIPYTGPIPGSRKKPDHSTLEWRMLFPESTQAKILPFLIEWGDVKNVPQDKRDLNKQQLKSVSCGIAADVMEQVYQPNIADNAVGLENGMLVLQQGEDIGFHLE